MHEELEEDEEMVNPLQAGTLLVDWTDPQKSMYVLAFKTSCILYTENLDQCCRDVYGRQTDEIIHFDLAVDIVKALFNKELDSKLHFTV